MTINTAEIEARLADMITNGVTVTATGDLEISDDLLATLAATEAALKAETARADRYAERLEITHVFEVGDSGEFVRVEIPREDWDKQIDGIECREQTIKEQDRENEELHSQLTAANEKLAAIGDFAHNKSTGPAVEDGYWEIRGMAYGTGDGNGR